MKKLASGFASVGACVLRRVGIIKFPPPSKILKGPILHLGIGRIVALCAVWCLTCCTYQAYTVRYSVDYADYINSGFWIFPSEAQPTYKYLPIASIAMEYGEEFGPGAADDITPNKILDMLVERAKTRGANGLIGVRIYRELDANKRPVWQASGVAVKFEDVPLESGFQSANNP